MANIPIVISKKDSKLITSELVSVQPLDPIKYPAGYFYMDYKYVDNIKVIRKKKLIKLDRLIKMEYIVKLLKNN